METGSCNHATDDFSGRPDVAGRCLISNVRPHAQRQVFWHKISFLQVFFLAFCVTIVGSNILSNEKEIIAKNAVLRRY